MGKLRKFIFHLPCYMTIGSKKVSLTMNWYRNTHFQVLCIAKRNFIPAYSILFKAEEIKIDYTLILNNKRRTDLTNWISIADKFFLDWLVASGCIPDDNATHYANMTARAIVDTSAKETYIRADVTKIK